MAKRTGWFRGTCSNCGKTKVRVHKCGSTQVCKGCGVKLQVPQNQRKVWG